MPPRTRKDVTAGDAVAAAATAPHRPAVGRLVDDCAIDLPVDDVVQRVEYERFLRLNLRFDDLDGPATLGILAPPRPFPNRRPHGVDVDLGAVRRPVAPLSSDGADWSSFSRTVGLAEAAAAAEPGRESDRLRNLTLAFYLPFVQTWTLDGYSQGRLVNSFTLAPGEEQTVEVFTWDRQQTALESTTSTEIEETTESSGTRRDANDVASDVSRQAGFEMTAGGKVGFSVGVVKADLNASTSAKTQLNDAEKDTRSHITEATTRASNTIRTSRTLKVSESREFGREERVTRKLRNSSTCHTLTLPFFEVLAAYTTRTALDAEKVALVVLIPSTELLDLGPFGALEVRLYESVLRQHLLEPDLAAGIDAAKLLEARSRACHVLCEGCDCDQSEWRQPGALPGWSEIEAAAKAVAAAVRKITAKTVIFPRSVLGASVGDSNAVADVQAFLMRQHLTVHAPTLLASVANLGIGSSVAPPQVTQLATVLAGVSPEARGRLIQDSDPRDWWTVHHAATTFGLDPLFAASGAADRVRDTTANFTAQDEGLLAAIAAFDAAYPTWTQSVATAQAQSEKQAELARLAREEREARILQTFGLREVAEAQERLEALIKHLNDPRHQDHYRFAVWSSLSGRFDSIVSALALAGYTDATPVGVVENNLAVPLRLTHGTPLAEFFDRSVADLRDRTPATTERIVMTTAALHLEAVTGRCCTCSPAEEKERAIELHRRELENELVELEVARLRARLAAVPPDLDPPSSGTPALHLDVTTREAARPVAT